VRLGFWELLLIAVVVILLFSGKRLARLVQAFGRSKTEYQKGLDEPIDVESRVVTDEAERARRDK
jgi:sec-independent protein translocase protein TatA